MSERMKRISRRKEKYGNNKEISRDNFNEGTAARTRPFSFDDIMLRRKSKKLSADAKDGAGETGKVSGKASVDNVSDDSESDGGYRHSKDSVFGVTRRASDDTVKGSSRTKEESTFMKGDNLVKGKDEESRDLGTNLKAESNKYLSSKVEGGKNVKHSQRRSKNDERPRDDSENVSEKKRSKDIVEKDRYIYKNTGKSERGRKRKHQNGDDGKHRSEIDRSAVKRYDPGKLHDSEPSERKSRRKESSQSRYEEERPKRRRSREHDRDRDRRSFSLSPREHKHTSYHGREHGDSLFRSLKDKSERQHSDIDRNRMSNNDGYASSHYRQLGGSASGLGGYSPRKRRSGAAVKTPSPTNRSPERKSAGWDHPPTGTGTISAGSTLSKLQSSHQIVTSNAHELPIAVLVTSTTARPLSGASSNTVPTTKSVLVDSIQLTLATRPMRTLYIENVPASASENSVVECLNNFLLSLGGNYIKGTQPCLSCIINKEKGEALVEFLTPEDASTALSFNGRSFSGSILKIRRPKDFVESVTGVPEKSVAAAYAISDVVKDSPHKIFVGGISKAISSDKLMEIANAFGILKAFHFQLNEVLNESCAFLEYFDQSITLKACAGLNGMKLGGKVLTVVQAVPDASTEESTEKPPFYGIPEHAKPLLEEPTQVLKLRNVLNQEDLSSLSGPELEETLEDIRLECARFGTVKSVNVVKYSSCCVTTPEAFEVANDSDMGTASQDLEGADNTKKTETLEEAVEHDSEINSRPEPPSDVRELIKDGGVTEGNSISDDKPVYDRVKNELNEPCQLDIDGTPQEFPNQLHATEDQLAYHDDKGADTILAKNSELENNLMADEELRPEEANGKLQKASTALNSTIGMEPYAINKGDGKEQASDLGDAFEPGCVLVEYLRTEASCVAAHCLHGRLFGDRTVEVGYATHDLYLTRFSK